MLLLPPRSTLFPYTTLFRSHLSKIEGRPINQILNEAIKIFLRQKGRNERSLEASLASLDAYRKKDPGFKRAIDRKSTCLNSSHTVISYAVFCLKKKKEIRIV